MRSRQGRQGRQGIRRGRSRQCGSGRRRGHGGRRSRRGSSCAAIRGWLVGRHWPAEQSGRVVAGRLRGERDLPAGHAVPRPAAAAAVAPAACPVDLHELAPLEAAARSPTDHHLRGIRQ